MTEAMDRDGENSMVDVPERENEDLVITVIREPERTSEHTPSWAERVAQTELTPSHSDASFRPSYPNHLRSEIMAFDGELPDKSLGELPVNDQQRFLRLNIVPNRPCSATFTLADNTVDSKYILDKIVSMGISKTQVACIQRSRSGQVNVTFSKADLRDLFLSKLSTTFQQRPTVPRQAWQSGTFVTVRDAPWELSDKLIQHRLEQFGIVHSIRRAFNQSLLPERIPDGRRVLRMTITEPIPPFMRFGPFLVRIFYPEQPRVCWKCGSPEHIGRSCPYHYCFNCDESGHLAYACEKRLKCSLCKAEDHLAIDCPGNWGRRTRAQRTPRRTEEPPEDQEEFAQQDQEEESICEDDESSQRQSNDSGASSDDNSDDNMEREEGVSDIEQFSTSEDSNVSPSQRKRGAMPEAHVKKKSRTEDPPP